MRRNKYCLGLLTSFLIVNSASAQTSQPNVINAAGGSATVGADIFEWSVGEMALINTAIAPGIMVTQGLLQPTEQSNGIGESKLSLSELSVYPNPTTHQLWINWNKSAKVFATIQVKDLTGRLYFQKQLTDKVGTETYLIDLSLLSAGAYLLTIDSKINGQNFFNNFKVLKH